MKVWELVQRNSGRVVMYGGRISDIWLWVVWDKAAGLVYADVLSAHHANSRDHVFTLLRQAGKRLGRPDKIHVDARPGHSLRRWAKVTGCRLQVRDTRVADAVARDLSDRISDRAQVPSLGDVRELCRKWSEGIVIGPDETVRHRTQGGDP